LKSMGLRDCARRGYSNTGIKCSLRFQGKRLERAASCVLVLLVILDNSRDHNLTTAD
jgi:hypothetical protein